MRPIRTPDGRQVEVYESAGRLIEAVAHRTVHAIEAAIAERGRCAWALSGGRTPVDAFRKLAAEPYRSSMEWDRLDVFWGDERVVPADHAESNYNAAREALLDRVPLPERNVHRVRTGLGADGAADDYGRVLGDAFGSARPRFGLVWLGMGVDGHTASLFPGSGAAGERERMVAAVRTDDGGPQRVTLTVPALNAARETLILVSGESKADMLRQVLTRAEPTAALPVTLVRPTEGVLRWMVDADAAQLIEYGAAHANAKEASECSNSG